MSHHIIVAEDDEHSRNYLTKILEHRGHTVYPTIDAIEAARIFQGNPHIMVIVSDYDMGGGDKNGDALFAATRDELARRNGTFILTSDIAPERIREYLAKQGVKVILKVEISKRLEDTLGIPKTVIP